MKILVPIKRVVDYAVKIRVKSDQSGVEQSNVKMSINPFDEIAIEEAVRLKEKGMATEVVAVTIGSHVAQDILRTALAMGVDRAILIETTLPTDLGGVEPLAVAKLLRAVVIQESVDLIILGKQAIDDDSNQTGQMLATILNWPLASFASELSWMGDGRIQVTCEVDGGSEVISMSLPAVVSSDLRLNTPRYASLPNIMKARQKPLAILKSEDFYEGMAPRLRLISVSEPPARPAGIIVENVDQLLSKLKLENAS